MSCLCEKRTEFLGCLTDVCPFGNFFPARDHYLGTCLEHIPELRTDSDFTFWIPGYKAPRHFDDEDGCSNGNDCSKESDCCNGCYDDDYFIPDPDFDSDGLSLSFATYEQREKVWNACDEKIDMLKRQIRKLVKFRKVRRVSLDHCY
ncbi:unnamed protein product [Ambrosiozyma monospora]|uniref:Unnamed protein product n=1 Tax=Ambrosiozyma monospora TaxID=43982 RepID=A0A9W7DG83_AMBMO|nr:unnamed protein product [Ambrosiozyma monospora]